MVEVMQFPPDGLSCMDEREVYKLQYKISNKSM